MARGLRPGGKRKPRRTPLPRGSVMTFFVLVVVGGLSFADLGIIVPFARAIGTEFKLSEPQVGLVGSLFFVVMGAALLLWGYLADRHSRKLLLLLGSVIWSLTAYGVSLSRTYEELLLMRSLGGAGVASFFPVAFSMTADIFGPGRRGKAAGLLFLLPTLGAVGGGVAAFMLGVTHGWRAPFQAIGVAGLAATVLFALLMKEPARAQTEPEFRERVQRGQTYAYKLRLSDLRVVYRERSNLYLLLQGIPGTVPWGALFFWAPFYLQEHKGFSEVLSLVYLVGFFGGSIFGNLIGGFVGDHLGRKGIQRRVPLCIAGIVGGMLLIVWALFIDIPRLPPGFGNSVEVSEILRFVSFTWGEWGFLAPSLLLFGAGILSTLTGPNWFAVMQDINLPEVRGSIAGINNIMSQIGQSIGPLSVGFLAQGLGGGAGGLRTALILSTLFWIACAALWVPIYRALPAAERRARETLAARAGEPERVL